MDSRSGLQFESGRCCYADSMDNFNKLFENNFVNKIKSSFLNTYTLDLTEEQIYAWRDSFKVMQNISLHPDISIIFEYSLPYTSGRRPDVILLSNKHVVILEFKMKNSVKYADLDQIKSYARDIGEYHFESRDKKIISLLVLTKTFNVNENIDGVLCVSKDMLQCVLNEVFSDHIETYDFKKWIFSKYEPLPTIVEVAKRIMRNDELPNIRRVNSTCIPQTLKYLKDLTSYAKYTKKHIIAFVTGVPGAGKTYLGLQYVYDVDEQSICLSGNGPLVEVISDALKSDVFIKEIRNIVDEFCLTGAPDFNKNVIVFDEGQRAWDEQRMKNNGINYSEHEIIIKLCEKRLDWCVLLILVGEGQEINKGENSGLNLWEEALNNSDTNWEIVCPPKVSSIFKNQIHENKYFDLTVSLRSHLSGNVSEFVNYIVEGDVENASKLSEKIFSEGYDMYCTRDIEKAKEYCINRYVDEPSKRFGLIASSKGRGLFKYGIRSGPEDTKKVNKAKWFNAPVFDRDSCCSFKFAVSEFDIQGLELDMPIIGWGLDMQWNGERWLVNNHILNKNTNADIFRQNCYRVLLTRGRDGFIIFVPSEYKNLDLVYNMLLKCGIKKL